MAALKNITHEFGRAFREAGQALNILGFRAADDLSFRDHYSRHRTIMSIMEDTPSVSTSAFIAPCAAVIGNVEVNNEASVWYGAVIRGDENKVTIAAGANVQDMVIIKTTAKHSTSIGENVTIGHNAVLTGCTVHDTCLIGMGAVVGEGAVVESNSLVAAGAVVLPGSVVGGGELWGGNPAKCLRELKPAELKQLPFQASEYCKLADAHRESVKLI